MTRAILLAGLAFGDEAKGATVDFLCRQTPIHTIVRYNGGPQAAHNVVTPEGVHHTFSQFGSGMLASPTVHTHLSRFMLVEPIAMCRESFNLLRTPHLYERFTIDGDCVVIIEPHILLNRLREEFLGGKRHGSCGRGVGVARELALKHPNEVLRMRHIRQKSEFVSRVRFLFDRITPEVEFLSDALKKTPPTHRNDQGLSWLADQWARFPFQIVDGMPEPAKDSTLLFEGAQGVLLDETHGYFPPHVTWTNTTFENADTLLDELGVPNNPEHRLRIGCLRSYFTRHGAGPFRTEYPSFLPKDLPEPHNADTEFAGRFRKGAFDYVWTARALKIAGNVDFLAVSHLDRCPVTGIPAPTFLSLLASKFGIPIGIRGYGPTASDRQIHPDLADWLTVGATSSSSRPQKRVKP